MPKRDPEPEPLDEELVEPSFRPVGERLRAAREEKKLSLEDVAAQTRIPLRHLASIETADWDNLPAPTYTIGFAKSYASAVGLDRAEIGDQLREEMGGQRFASTLRRRVRARRPAADHAQIAGVRGDRRGHRPDRADELAQQAVARAAGRRIPTQQLLQSREPPTAAAADTAAPAPAVSAQGPVVLTATAPAWIQVSEQGKTLF